MYPFSQRMETGSFNAKRRLVLCSALAAVVAIGGYLKRGHIENDPEIASSQGNSRYSEFERLRRLWLFGHGLVGDWLNGPLLLRFWVRCFLAVRVSLRQEHLEAGVASASTAVAMDANASVVPLDDSIAYP